MASLDQCLGLAGAYPSEAPFRYSTLKYASIELAPELPKLNGISNVPNVHGYIYLSSIFTTVGYAHKIVIALVSWTDVIKRFTVVNYECV
jgi:hypothetical protein